MSHILHMVYSFWAIFCL